MKKNAFTLAEVLTTLMVIGVVAALTIPALMQNIGGLEKQKTTFARKLEQGLHRMAVQDKLGKKYTTKSFVKELKNFFTITSTCDSNNLTKCFGEKIKNDEDEFELANLKSAKNFNSEYPDAPVYGVLFNDGTSMLLAYDPSCRGYSSSDIPKDNGADKKSQLAAISSFTKNCLYYLYDINGTKGDNTVGADFDMMGTLIPVKGNDNFGLSFSFEIANSGARMSFDDAIEACGGQDKLLSTAQLQEIANKLYEDCTVLEEYDDEFYGYKSFNDCSSILANNPLWQKISGGNSSVGFFVRESSRPFGIMGCDFTTEAFECPTSDGAAGIYYIGNAPGSVACVK